MITVGAKAPDFTLKDQYGNDFQLSRVLATRNVLLNFIPAAFTQICGVEVPSLASFYDLFLSSANTVAVVITADNHPSNLGWMRYLNIAVPYILSDYEPKGKVCQQYGCWNAQDGIPDRASVLVGQDGVVKFGESVTKFGRRDVPSLLMIAQKAAGLPVQAPETIRTRIEMPILFVSNTCMHCAAVREQLQKLQLDTKIVVRVVNGDNEAVQWLLSVQPSGDVPVLFDVDKTLYVGGPNVIEGLRRIAKRVGLPT